MIVGIKDVFKSYDRIPAVNGVTMNIEKAELVVILGPSGCGKTTLLRMIAGFIEPDKGSITIDGLVVSKDGKSFVEPEHRKIGMIFQDLTLWPHMSVYGNLEFGLRAKKIAKNERKVRIIKILKKLQIIQFQSSYPDELSGGQQQRVALARALVMRPKVLLMDEPLSHLDHDLNLMLRKEIIRLHKELETTMLFVTHDRDEAYALATRIIVMEQGRVKIEGSAPEVSKYFNSFTVQ